MWVKSFTQSCMRSMWSAMSRLVAVYGFMYDMYDLCPQRAPSSFSFPIISSTVSTLTPASLEGGSVTLSVSSLGLRSTPKSAAVNFSSGFFFAFMIFGRDA
jgi:hypothetical protein